MSKDNVWYYKVDSEVEESVISYFTSTNKWGNVIYKEAEFRNQRYNDTELSRLYGKHRYMHVPEDIYNYVYKYLYMYIDMYVRWSPWALFIYDQKNIHDYLNLFNRDINFIFRLLTEREINLIIFPRAPHMGGDLILYLLAEKMGLKTQILEQSWIFANKFFHYSNLKDYGCFSSSKTLSELENLKIEKKFQKDLSYMDDIYNKNKKTYKNFLRNKFRPEYRLLIESISDKGWEQSLYRYSLRKKYKKNMAEIVEKDLNMEKSYVYFPLHLQPEQTTSMWGGKYNDQLLALERLSHKLPDNWYIYVKENPGQNFFMRGEYFFERLHAIPRVKVAPTSMSTYHLLAKSQFAATITGTVGWEAITGGKNVLVFGWGVWYKTLPGVFEYREDLDIQDILNFKIDHSELQQKVSVLKTKMGTGIMHCKSMISYPEYDEEINKRNIIDSLEKILYGC